MAGQSVERELTTAEPTSSVGRDGCFLAGTEDDEELRALLRRSPTPGAVRVAFTREPRYSAAEGLAGATDYTVVHRDRGRLDAIGRLSAHRLHRNAAPIRIGYLGELRVAPEARRTPQTLRDGYAMLGGYARAEGLEGCFTSIAADNARARRVLEHGGRLGVPTYAPLGHLVTLLLRVRSRNAGGAARADDRDELTDFLNAHARTAQLTLTWDDARWEGLARQGVRPSDFLVVRERGRVAAAGAVWDQRPFRQVVVSGYAGALRLARPLVNVAALFAPALRLPAPGSVLAQGMIFGAAVREPRLWPTLVFALARDAAARGLEWLVLARDARDPDLGALRPLRAREYHTRLYDVRWAGTSSWPDPWNGSPFRPEVALL